MQLLRSMCVTAKFDTAQRKMSEDTVVVLHYIYCTKQAADVVPQWNLRTSKGERYS